MTLEPASQIVQDDGAGRSSPADSSSGDSEEDASCDEEDDTPLYEAALEEAVKPSGNNSEKPAKRKAPVTAHAAKKKAKASGSGVRAPPPAIRPRASKPAVGRGGGS